MDEEEELGDKEGSKEDTDGSKGETQYDITHVIDINDYLVWACEIFDNIDIHA